MRTSDAQCLTIVSGQDDRKVKESHKTLPQRIELVGKSVFPHGWTRRLSEGLGISRSMLWEYRNGRRTDRDIYGRMLDLIYREHAAAAARSMMLTKLRHRMAALIGAAKKREGADA